MHCIVLVVFNLFYHTPWRIISEICFTGRRFVAHPCVWCLRCVFWLFYCTPWCLTSEISFTGHFIAHPGIWCFRCVLLHTLMFDIWDVFYRLFSCAPWCMCEMCFSGCCVGPVKAVARRQKPLHNLHSVVKLTKQLLTQLIHDLGSEVKILPHFYQGVYNSWKSTGI